jgi:hypothetical protein
MAFYLLQGIQHLSQPGDVVFIEVQGSAGKIRLRIHSPEPTTETPSQIRQIPNESLATRALSLADAIVTGGGGTFRLRMTPLLIVADFPVKREKRAHSSDQEKPAEVALPI